VCGCLFHYDGDADDYGANGFHLTFEDPDDIGEDSAPIGATGHTAANNFTATGFDTAPVGIFSTGLSSNPAGGSQTDYRPAADRIAVDNPTQAFNNNTGNWASTPGHRQRIYWVASTQLENVTTLRINNSTGQMQNLFINGTDTGFTSTTGPGWIDISAQIPADGIITEISRQLQTSS
jgi:hypothetical protein